MIIILARTKYENIVEGDDVKDKYLEFGRCGLMVTSQKQCLIDLVQVAKGENDERCMEMLLISFNPSIFIRHMPSQDSTIEGISEKCPSLAYCNLYFLKFDGSFRNLRDVTEAHATIGYCFRA